MVVLGVLLLAAAAGLAVDVLVQNTAAINVDALGQTWSLSPGWLLMVGAAVGVCVAVAVALIALGVARGSRRRHDLRKYHRSTESLQAERDRLASELERERVSKQAPLGERGASSAESIPAASDGQVAAERGQT